MLEQEFSSPGPELSSPGAEYGPTGQALSDSRGEFFPDAPEVDRPTELTDASGPLSVSKRKKHDGRRGIVRQAAAAVAIGAVTVTTVMAVSPAPARPSREPAQLTASQREYLDEAYEAMYRRDDAAVEALMTDGGETFEEIYLEVLVPYAQSLGAAGTTGDVSDIVYDGESLLPRSDVPYDTPYMMLSVADGGEISNRFLGFFLDSSAATVTATVNASRQEETFSWEYGAWLSNGSFADSVLVESVVRHMSGYDHCSRVEMTGDLENVTFDSGPLVSSLVLRSGTVTYSCGDNGVWDSFGSATVEDFKTVSLENLGLDYDTVGNAIYPRLLLRESGSGVHSFDTFVLPMENSDRSRISLVSGDISYLFGVSNVARTDSSEPSEPSVPDVPSVPDMPSDPSGEVSFSGQAGPNVTWTIYEDGRLVFEGTGDMYDWLESSPAPWYNLDFTTVEIGQGVANMGDYAFFGSSLEAVSFPSTLTDIGNFAFYGCSLLTRTQLPYNIRSIGQSAFADCANLMYVDIPGYSLTYMGAGVFSNCLSLRSIAIPMGISELGAYTFLNCQKLTDITLPAGLNVIGENALAGCEALTELTVPNGVTEIMDRALAGCTSLEKLHLPRTVSRIGSVTLSECISLTDIYFDGTRLAWSAVSLMDPVPQGVTVHFTDSDEPAGPLSGTAGDNVTWTLSDDGTLTLTGSGDMHDYDVHDQAPWSYELTGVSITRAVFDDRITSVGAYSFKDAVDLASVELPDSLLRIGEGAFSGCHSLIHVDLPDGLLELRDMAFLYCYALEGIELPDSLTLIGGRAFDSDISLTSITIPDSVTRMYDSAFYYTGLTSVTFGQGLTTIPIVAFMGCPLTVLELPESVTRLESGAFSSTDLVEVYIPGSVIYIYFSAFDNCPYITDCWFGGTQEEWEELTHSGGPFDHEVTMHYQSSPSDMAAGNSAE